MTGRKVLMNFEVTPTSHTLESYLARGGYKTLEKVLRELRPEDVTNEIVACGVQGRGGAAFPAGRKWQVVDPHDGQPHFLIANADEGEPGTFKDNRVIDLSYVAAAKLDMIREGTAMVEVRSVGPSSPAPRPVTPAQGRFFAQAGAFAEEDNARRLARRLADAGFDNVLVVAADANGRGVHRVRIGPLDSVDAFDAVVTRLRDGGFGAAILALD